jgi:hypothetical protein
MGAMPADLGPGLRKDARIGLGKAHGGTPGLLEGQPFRQRELVMGVSDLGNIEGKAGPILVIEALGRSGGCSTPRRSMVAVSSQPRVAGPSPASTSTLSCQRGR